MLATEHRLLASLATILLAVTPSVVVAEVDPQHVEFFEQKIRPVLAQHCYPCHNSLETQEGGLALDYRHALLTGGDSGEVVVPGKPEESLLIWAIRHENGYEMPAEAAPLDDAVIRDFERWIELGAPDPRTEPPTAEQLAEKLPWEQVREQRKQWWAFQPLVKHQPPEVDDSQWTDGALDRFVYARMRDAGLAPQPVASPEVLVRRLHLILIGLPPEPAVVEAFVADPSLVAYEQLVDSLLASEAFGERWARHWMDWYRYAETHGSEVDPQIPYAQVYRDYLIRALNADVPYDQLLREHLAGDLLDEPRINDELQLNESAIGTAHLRMVPHGYGVTDAYGEQITFIDNQIDVISKAMLGVTVSCARCHDHKFDPISQKDFYRFYGILMSGRPSTVLVDSPEKLRTNQAAMAALNKEIRHGLAELWLKDVERLPEWLDEQGDVIDADVAPTNPLYAWMKLRDAAVDDYPEQVAQLESLYDGSVERNAQAIAAAKLYVDLGDAAHVDRWFASGNGTVAEVSPAGSFALHAEGDEVVRGVYPSGVYSHLLSDKHAAVFSSANIRVEGKYAQVRMVGQNAQFRMPMRNYPLNYGLHPTINLDGKFGLQWWMHDERKWEYWQGDLTHVELRTARDIIPNPKNEDRSWFGVTEIYVGDEPLVDTGAPLVAFVDDPSAIIDRRALAQAYANVLREVVANWAAGELADSEAEFLDAFVQRGALTNRTNELPTELQQHVAEYRKLEAAIPVPTRAPGVLETAPVDQPLLVRGDYKQEAEPVARQFLEIYSDREYDDRVPGRLQLFQDVVSPANTLTSRVLVNRLWAYVFGRGIVATTDNFGRLGSKPTHPELLEYLAIEFMRDGWSIKRALRRLVTSRAFRSASSADSSVVQQDPENIYLSYFKPRRLDAEAIYDSVHRLAGEEKRAVYLPVARNDLNQFLATFNAPIPASAVSRRVHTNVPAQALAMLNGELIEQAARSWSNAIKDKGELDDSDDRLTAMFLQAYARRPGSNELELLRQVLHNTSEGLYRVAHALLNSQEFIYVY